MKKTLLIFTLLIISIFACLGFAACNRQPKSDGVGGIYYLFEDGELDKGTYFMLDEGTWSDGEDSGEYKLEGDNIYFYIGNSSHLHKGTVKNGKMVLTVFWKSRCEITFYKEGKQPASDGNHKHTYAKEWTSDEDYHYYLATCEHDVVSNKAEHNFDGTQCRVCGYIADPIRYKLNEDEKSYTLEKLYDNSVNEFVIPNEYNGLPVTTIGQKAFYNCGNLQSITIGSNIIEIGTGAFLGCRNLDEVNIFDIVDWCKINFDNYSTNPLYYSHNLYVNGNLVTNLVFPKEVTQIGDYAFYGCGLERITIEGDASIGNYAFYSCENIESILITGNVSSIGRLAFSGCGKLMRVDIVGSINCIDDNAFADCVSLESVVFNTGLTQIGNYAFSGCSKLNNLMLHEGLLSVGWYAFAYCSELVELTIPNSVTSLGKSAFTGCKNLEKVTIGNELGEIGSYSFYNCSKLREITIGSGVKMIGYRAFTGCEKLAILNIVDIAAWCQIEFESHDANPIYFTNKFYMDGELITDLVIPDEIPLIRKMAFYNCELKKVTIPDTVESVGTGAFAGCPIEEATVPVLAIGSVLQGRLTKLVVTSGETIPTYVFQESKTIKSVTLCEGIKTIEKQAFMNCSNLNELILVDTIESIGWAAFYGCNSLTEINMPSSLVTIEDRAFSNCSGLTEIILPNKLVHIGNFAFSNCDKVTEFVVPEGVTYIGSYAFSDCNDLRRVVLPVGVKSIGDNAFVYSGYLQEVLYKGTEEDWSSVNVSRYTIKSDVLYFYSATRPANQGNYWYYDGAGKPTIWS